MIGEFIGSQSKTTSCKHYVLSVPSAPLGCFFRLLRSLILIPSREMYCDEYYSLVA